MTGKEISEDIYLTRELLEKLQKEGLSVFRSDETMFHKVEDTGEGQIAFQIESENPQVFGLESQQERHRYTQYFKAIDKAGESTYVKFTSSGPTADSPSRVYKVLVTIMPLPGDSRQEG